MVGGGVESDPWHLKDPSGSSTFLAHCDPAGEPPLLVCRVDVVPITYLLRSIDDLYQWLQSRGTWVPLGIADERQVPESGSVEVWARSADNPVGGWYGQRPGYRGRFAMFVPPVLEHLGLIELEHNLTDNRCRAANRCPPYSGAERGEVASSDVGGPRSFDPGEKPN